MKKIDNIYTDRDRRLRNRYNKICKREAGKSKFNILKTKYAKNIKQSMLSDTIQNRSIFVKKYYSKQKFNPGRKIISIHGEFGIENDLAVNNFFNFAQQILSKIYSQIYIDLRDCDRIWPSAVTLLCAFAEWIRVVSHKDSKPKVAHYNSKFLDVNKYLAHCGFCDFVNTDKKEKECEYDNEKVIKIKHETTLNTESREKEIVKILKSYTDLSLEEIEIFDDRISTEIFNNVTEHGIPKKDAGWWILAQHHETHELVSLCIADNGIGIRNSLMTGPQREFLKAQVRNHPINEGEFIRKAIEKNISGAFTAPIKEDKYFGLMEQYPRGEKRGKGLQRITQNCARLGIQLTIMSRHGVFVQDHDGNISRCLGFEEQIFAGTMYHLNIKTSRVL